MEQFRLKTMSVKLTFTCVNDDYFDVHFRNYYDYLDFDIRKSKFHGNYCITFYKLKSLSDIMALELDTDFYYKLPCFICASEIY